MNKPTTLCIYHGNCADGFGAAWALRRAIPDAEFYAATHGCPPPEVLGKHVYIVDFSYPKAVIEGIAVMALTVTIIDHHKSAAEELAEYQSLGWMRPAASADYFYNELLALELEHTDNIRAHFDMAKSGAVLTWEHFFPGEPTPQLLLHIQDRDLWEFKLPHTRAIQAALFSYEHNFDRWDVLIACGCEDLAVEGAAITRSNAKTINEFIKVAAYRDTIAGHDVPVLNAPYFWASDAGHIMGKGEKFAACYWDGPRGRVYSLRSEPEGLDVSKIAQKFGGGGHEHAAGFTIPRKELVGSDAERFDRIRCDMTMIACGRDHVTGEALSQDDILRIAANWAK